MKQQKRRTISDMNSRTKWLCNTATVCYTGLDTFMLIERNKGMSETKDTQGTEIKTKRDLPKLGVGPIGSGKSNTMKLSTDEKQITKEIIRSALRDKINDDNAFTDTEIVLTRRFGPSLVSEVLHEEEALFRKKNMEETKPTQETEAKLAKPGLLTIHGLGGIGKTSLAKQYAEREEAEKEQIRNELDHSPKDLNSLAATIMDLMKRFDSRLISEVIHEEEKDAISKVFKDPKLRAEESKKAREELLALHKAELKSQQFHEAIRTIEKAAQTLMPKHNNPTTIHFRIIEEPLTPQNLALAFTTLTELATKFWLVAKRRLPDLIEYTQTHDSRFADEAGSTIAWATYNSPFSFGFQVDKLVPSVADALMTVVNGLSQRKAHVEKLELDNQAAAQKIKEDEKKSELDQTKEQLAIERERVALLRETMEAQKQGIEYAIEITTTLVDITYPNADIETKGMIITTLLPGVLQLDNVRGLQLVLPETLPLESKATLDNTEPQQDAGQ